MTATTSKLGADMNDPEMNTLVIQTATAAGLRVNVDSKMLNDNYTNVMGSFPSLVRFTRAILARQPAAIDKQEASNSPFSNCKFRECDLPGQCRSEGKCHHPRAASTSANVAQGAEAVAVVVMEPFDEWPRLKFVSVESMRNVKAGDMLYAALSAAQSASGAAKP